MTAELRYLLDALRYAGLTVPMPARLDRVTVGTGPVVVCAYRGRLAVEGRGATWQEASAACDALLTGVAT